MVLGVLHKIYYPRLRSEEVCGDMARARRARVISPQTSDDRSRGPYICVIHRKTMVHIVYIMIRGQRAAR